MSVQISFHGGVDSVTGSCHLLRAGGLQILVDCGIFQGGPRSEKHNFEGFSFDPSSVDYLLLTHGHLDHCGRIPVLVNKGFRGKIICTAATYDIAKIVIMDSARIQEEDYRYWKKIGPRRSFVRRGPLYTTVEAIDSLQYVNTHPRYDVPVRLNNRIQVTFRDAGHIFGAAFIEIDIRGYGRIIFSGDLGNRNKPIIQDPVNPRKADVVVIEGTYSNRNHKDIESSVQELHQAIINTFKRKGNVLIPTFSIERAQDLLFYMREFYDTKQIPPCSVFLDSPMAISVTEIMRKYPEYFDEESTKLLQKNRDLFAFPLLRFTKTQEESMKINMIRDHAVIIAGSGMCTGGRIKHHLKFNIWRKESSIIFVGYQARGTLGRKIVDGKREVKIFGRNFNVKSRVYTIGGFSAHADREILTDWLQKTGKARHVFLVHGEKKNLLVFKNELEKKNMAQQVHIPGLNSEYEL